MEANGPFVTDSQVLINQKVIVATEMLQFFNFFCHSM